MHHKIVRPKENRKYEWAGVVVSNGNMSSRRKNMFGQITDVEYAERWRIW